MSVATLPAIRTTAKPIAAYTSVFFPLLNFSGFPADIIIWNPPTSTMIAHRGIAIVKSRLTTREAGQVRLVHDEPSGFVRPPLGTPEPVLVLPGPGYESVGPDGGAVVICADAIKTVPKKDAPTTSGTTQYAKDFFIQFIIAVPLLECSAQAERGICRRRFEHVHRARIGWPDPQNL